MLRNFAIKSYLVNITDTQDYNNGYQLMDKIDAYIRNNSGICRKKKKVVMRYRRIIYSYVK